MRAAQLMRGATRMVTNRSLGSSIVRVDIKEEYWADRLPQVWNEMRGKIRDLETSLPPGAARPDIGDDFGFVTVPITVDISQIGTRRLYQFWFRDVAHPDGRPFDGCPRTALKRVVAGASRLGYTMMVGPEAESNRSNCMEVMTLGCLS